MKKYAKTKDYVDYLNQRFDEAYMNQIEYVEITAKDLHEALSEKPTLPTCCSAMRRVMKEGDEILTDTENVSGSSVQLRIRYHIKNREGRSFMNPPKKRGRPAGYQKKMLFGSKKQKHRLSPEDALIRHLENCGIRYETEEHLILVHGDYGIWKIYIDHVRKGPKAGFRHKIFDLLTHFDDTAEKISLLIMSNPAYEKEWMKISDIVKQRLNLTLLKCTPRGKIKEII
ncbi:hypothetical protein DWW36_02320 [Erysipelotrichaceae bacterium AF15-26LB]|nr:hypothetical protein HMPREF0983_01690 [Erysipelotrichaceae bacterium 3_1_53]MCR0347757.1 hypothetical protein [[Clostridium] innocuum]RJV92414.1 hypothetical protein DWW36_02320 [Erysipelotrichaceae bacterium AF15-26LB]RJV92663.1 hypothetical protein DWX45_02765 [Erysipelotrichaceae bacterium AF19-24AC]